MKASICVLEKNNSESFIKEDSDFCFLAFKSNDNPCQDS